MSRPTPIKVISFLQKDSAISPTDGNKLCEEIALKISENSKSIVTIDFTDMKYITSAFINASIGKFLMLNPEKKDRLNYKTSPDQELDFRIERSVLLATNENLRNAHKVATEEILCY